jgi:hypothetical protein
MMEPDYLELSDFEMDAAEHDAQSAIASPIPIMYRANDPILHTDAAPFCTDDRCPCKEDGTMEGVERRFEFVWTPLDEGLLTEQEASRLLDGRQV